VPTDRARLTITETDDVVRMLDEAAQLWPADREHRGRLLKRLAERGAEAARVDHVQATRRWASVVDSVAGAAGPDAYPGGYLENLRDDWPA